MIVLSTLRKRGRSSLERLVVPFGMMRPLFGLFLLFACGPGPTTNADVAIRNAMQLQQVAWNNGDIPGFMIAYSDTICFISKKGRTCGKAAVTSNYQKSYPDKATMGQLQFGIHEVLPANDHAWVTGSWELHREKDTVGGGFSLFWVNEDGNWRIVRDHTY